MRVKLLLFILSFAVLAIFVSGQTTKPAPKLLPPLPAEPNSLVMVAAGDIACDSNTSSKEACNQAETARVVIESNPNIVLTLGDLQYGEASLEDFEKFYGASWGLLKERTYPSLGNHDYEQKGAKGYFDYFGSRAGEREKGYYSFNEGEWHFISLNSNCWAVGGCGENSPQYKWLKEDLLSSKKSCTLAYWHHPLFSSGSHQGSEFVKPFWDLLYQYKADVILNGHDHVYERFALQDSDGKVNEQGIRQFTVGTGGRNLYGVKKLAANSEVVETKTFGVLKLVLEDKKYTWEFLPIKGQNFRDAGSGSCAI